jgi:hypothetical protein
MKKLFAIAIAASLISGGLYAFSFGLGVAYDELGIDSLYGKGHLAIKADMMCKPFPILGFRFGLVDVEMRDDDFGGTMFTIATGCDATVMFYIPMAGMLQPYIPIYFKYADTGDLDQTTLYIFGGVGGEMGFGSVTGYLEGRFTMLDISTRTESQNWFTIQGGVRVPINM